MGKRRRPKAQFQAPAEPVIDAAADEAVRRDAEESLVAALQESDTAVEALQDTSADAQTTGWRRHWTIGAAGLLLALLGLVVTRRRR